MTQGARGDEVGWSATRGALQDEHDVLLLDLDGVVYVGADAVPGAPEALAAARSAGLRLAFVTNNAARSPGTVASHLSELGVPASVDDVVTSAQAAATVLLGLLHPGAAVLVVGGDGLREAVTAVGLLAVASADDGPAAVVQGFSPQVSWASLLEACVGIRLGVPYVATNPDLTIPTPRGIAPGNGALVAVVSRTTGVEPVVAGKPFRPIMDEAVRRTSARAPLVIGDRLDTDVAGGTTAGLPSLLVLTGVHAVTALLEAPDAQRPTYLAADLSGLATAQPGCAADGDAWVCGPVSAAFVGGDVTLTRAASSPGAAAAGGGQIEVGNRAPSAFDALCAVRAACSLVWAAAASSQPPLALDQAREALRPWTAPHGWDR